MATPLSQPRTSIVDLPEEERELATDELLLIVNGGATDCENENDSVQTGNKECDAPKMF